MVLLNFKKQHSALVESGEKTMTIRKHRKRPFVPGDELQLYTGLRTKTTRKLGDAVCLRVRQISIDKARQVLLDGEMLSVIARQRLAKLDGFASSRDFTDFFESVHGLPFRGEIIEWELKHVVENETKGGRRSAKNAESGSRANGGGIQGENARPRQGSR